MESERYLKKGKKAQKQEKKKKGQWLLNSHARIKPYVFTLKMNTGKELTPRVEERLFYAVVVWTAAYFCTVSFTLAQR